MASAEITVNVTGLDEFKRLVARVAELEADNVRLGQALQVGGERYRARVAELQDAVAERGHLATWQALTVARKQVAELEADNRRLTAWTEELTSSLREAGEEEIDQAAKTSSAAYDVEAFRNTVADLEERLIAACGREGDRTAERDTAQARVAELEETAATTIAGHAQAMVDQGRQLDTALAALESLTVAAAQYTATGKVSSSEELFAESLLAMAMDGAVAVLRRHDDSPMVAVGRADLSLLIGGLDAAGQWDEELSAAYLRAAALLQPARGTGQIVLDHEIRETATVEISGGAL